MWLNYDVIWTLLWRPEPYQRVMMREIMASLRHLHDFWLEFWPRLARATYGGVW